MSSSGARGPAGPAGPIGTAANAGVALPAEGEINFKGGLAAVDNAINGRTDVDVSGEVVNAGLQAPAKGNVAHADGAGLWNWRRQAISVLDYGAVPDNATDLAPAFDAACAAAVYNLAALAAGVGTAFALTGMAATVKIPAGVYFASRTLIPPVGVRVECEHGAGWTAGTVIRFPAGVRGVFLPFTTTDGTANDAYGSWAEWHGGCLVAGNGSRLTVASYDGASHGIQVSGTQQQVRDLYVVGFMGMGFAIIGTGGLAQNDHGYGEPNLTRGYNCYADGNAGHGFYFHGGDANAGLWQGCSAISNGGWGIYDDSFLGNGIVGCHARGNAGALVPAGYGGTDIATAGGAEGGYCMAPALAGANVNAGYGLGNYSESNAETFLGQSCSWLAPVGAQVIVGPGSSAGASGGGNLANAWKMGAVECDIDDGAGHTGYIGLAGGAGTLVPLRALTLALTGLNPITLQGAPATNRWTLKSNDDLLQIYPNVVGALSGAVGMVGFHYGFKFGDQDVDWGSSSGAPAAGTHARGEIAFERLPVAGGFVGYVCVAGGTPGTWKGFGAIAP